MAWALRGPTRPNNDRNVHMPAIVTSPAAIQFSSQTHPAPSRPPPVRTVGHRRAPQQRYAGTRPAPGRHAAAAEGRRGLDRICLAITATPLRCYAATPRPHRVGRVGRLPPSAPLPPTLQPPSSPPARRVAPRELAGPATQRRHTSHAIDGEGPECGPGLTMADRPANIRRVKG